MRATIITVRFPLPVVDMSEVNKNKAGSEIFPTVSTEPTTPALSRPEEKYVFRWAPIQTCLFFIRTLTTAFFLVWIIWSLNEIDRDILLWPLFYHSRSVGQTTNTRINLGLLSVKGDAPRTANIICVPEHDIWKLKTFEEVKAFLVKSFPQIDFPTFVTDEEIARFASATPGEFPKPQYAKGIQQLFAHKKAGTAACGEYCVSCFLLHILRGMFLLNAIKPEWNSLDEVAVTSYEKHSALATQSDLIWLCMTPYHSFSYRISFSHITSHHIMRYRAIAVLMLLLTHPLSRRISRCVWGGTCWRCRTRIPSRLGTGQFVVLIRHAVISVWRLATAVQDGKMYQVI